MAVIPHPAPRGTSLPASASLRAVAVQRALPVVASVASVVIATLAVERAVASLALRAASSMGMETVIAPRQRAEATAMRTLVTETTVVEWITTRRR